MASLPKSQLSLGPMRVTTIDQAISPRSTTVDQAVGLMRRAVSDCGYTLDALETATQKGRAYIGKVLNSDKPMSLEFIVSLPHDVQARYEQLRAESLGLIVVVPALDREMAMRDLVRGLIGLLRDVA